MQFFDLCSDVLIHFIELLMKDDNRKTIGNLALSCTYLHHLVTESIHRNKSLMWRLRSVHIKMIQSGSKIFHVKKIKCFSNDLGLGIASEPTREKRNLNFTLTSLWGACSFWTIRVFSLCNKQLKYHTDTRWCSKKNKFYVHLYPQNLNVVIKVRDLHVFYELKKAKPTHSCVDSLKKKFMCRDGSYTDDVSVPAGNYELFSTFLNETHYQLYRRETFKIVHYLSPREFEIYTLTRQNLPISAFTDLVRTIWATSKDVFLFNGYNVYRLEFNKQDKTAELEKIADCISLPIQCDDELRFQFSKLYTKQSLGLYSHI